MKYHLVLFLFLLCYVSCKEEKKKVSLKDQDEENLPLILISKDFNNVFRNWLTASTKIDDFNCCNMYVLNSEDSLEILLKQADGIIISGGEDVHPSLYGKAGEINRCGEIDTRRDSLEQKMILYAIKNKIPLLGVCRGQQIINVTNGGTLIIDIPDDKGSLYLHRDIRKNAEHMSTRTYHRIYPRKNTMLYQIIQSDSSSVHSNHHQAVDNLAGGFAGSSYSKDMIIESIELSDTLTHPFILGVQWHPEAMDVRNPFSGPIGRRFMQKVKQHSKQNRDIAD
jgi:putative glutamine amidotransferase